MVVLLQPLIYFPTSERPKHLAGDIRERNEWCSHVVHMYNVRFLRGDKSLMEAKVDKKKQFTAIAVVSAYS